MAESSDEIGSTTSFVLATEAGLRVNLATRPKPGLAMVCYESRDVLREPEREAMAVLAMFRAPSHKISPQEAA